MTITALIVDTAAPAVPRKLTPAQPTGDNARCRVLFASSLQRSDAPGADAVAEALRVTVQQLGTDGCTGQMAQEFGDHPLGAFGVGPDAQLITITGHSLTVGMVDRPHPVRGVLHRSRGPVTSEAAGPA